MEPLQVYVAVLLITVTTINVDGAAVNNRPLIGLLSQESSDNMKQYGNEYVMSEYVKYLEMAGASVIIIKGKQPLKYYNKLFSQINGVLLPGGGVNIMNSSYARSSRIMFRLALQANAKGDYFPIWGTCQGFEMLTVLPTGKNLLSSTDSENLPLPLTLLPTFTQSRLLGNAPKKIINYLITENVTPNFHKECLATETYNQYSPLNKFYRAISVNKGRKGKEYVSTMEAFNYPFYGVQWHPEKSIFTRSLSENIEHSSHAVEVSQYFANFFVNEARKSLHKFPSDEARSQSVIENDNRVYIPHNYIEDFFYKISKR